MSQPRWNKSALNVCTVGLTSALIPIVKQQWLNVAAACNIVPTFLDKLPSGQGPQPSADVQYGMADLGIETAQNTIRFDGTGSIYLALTYFSTTRLVGPSDVAHEIANTLGFPESWSNTTLPPSIFNEIQNPAETTQYPTPDDVPVLQAVYGLPVKPAPLAPPVKPKPKVSLLSGILSRIAQLWRG